MSAWSEKSDSIEQVAKSFVAALGELSEVTKNKKADTGKFEYGYADLASTVAMVRPVLLKHGLAVSQTAGSEGDDVLIWTTVLHASGEFLSSMPLRFAGGQTAQQTGSAITYLRRYSLMAFLGLATEDDDGAGASVRNAPSGKARKVVEARRTDSKGVSVEPRTHHEAKIRRLIMNVSGDRQKQLREAFKAEFGSSLTGLAVERHEEALSWVETYAPTQVG